ncbi:MAG: sigma-54 dependent transcriptional regulator [candidate division WOR-3 bacterium]
MRILLVDDEARFCQLTAENLKAAGYDVDNLTDGNEALQRLKRGSYDVVITDLKMVPVDGMAILAAAKESNPETEVVMITGYGTIALAVEAMRQGAFDFITKPVSLNHLLAVLKKIALLHQTRKENLLLRQELKTTSRFAELVGESQALNQVRNLVNKVAPSDATILITGESGTGKELVARMIHRASPRGQKPFVVMHAAALPETLLESELFGYKAGAFTDARKDKPGRFALAEGGTIFLDEIGEISPAMQVRLLRVLQERMYEPLGGTESVKTNVRVVVATNRNLAQLVEEGKFRSDLYYRINVVRLTLPPLRERKEDIPLLVEHFITEDNHLRVKAITGVTPETMQILMAHNYPGNVRELENIIEHAFVVCEGGLIEPTHLPEFLKPSDLSVAPAPSTALTLKELEKQFILETLRRHNWNRLAAARALGIHKTTLFRKIKSLGLKLPQTDGRSHKSIK